MVKHSAHTNQHFGSMLCTKALKPLHSVSSDRLILHGRKAQIQGCPMSQTRLVCLTTLFPSAITEFIDNVLQNAHVSPMRELRNCKLLLHLELGLDYRLQISLPHTVPPDS